MRSDATTGRLGLLPVNVVNAAVSGPCRWSWRRFRCCHNASAGPAPGTKRHLPLLTNAMWMPVLISLQPWTHPTHTDGGLHAAGGSILPPSAPWPHAVVLVFFVPSCVAWMQAPHSHVLFSSALPATVTSDGPGRRRRRRRHARLSSLRWTTHAHRQRHPSHADPRTPRSLRATPGGR